VTSTEDNIANHGSVREDSPSTNIQGLSTSISDPSTRWDDIGPPYPYTDVIDLSLSWMG